MSREITQEEAQDRFLAAVARIAKYWGELPNKSNQERVEGCAFSILVLLDGGHAMMPAYSLIPITSEGDKHFHEKRGENYYPFWDQEKGNCYDIGGGLHERIHGHFSKSS